MSTYELTSWVASALVDAFSVAAEDAARRAHVVTSATGSSLPVQAGEVVAICRATARLPSIASWWRSEEGQRAFDRIDTQPDLAWAGLNEYLAAPAPDVLDPNWPASKVFWAVDRPDGSQPGDEFIVGSGEGERYLMRVVQKDGQVGVEWVFSLGTPLDSYWHWSVAEAESIIRRSR